MWNHITQTLQLVSLARGLMSLWKCATHSSLGNFSCTDEREGERCGYANSVEMARRPLRDTGPVPPGCVWWGYLQLGPLWGEYLSGIRQWQLRQTFAFVQHWRFWGSGSSLLVHQPLSLWSGFAYFRAVRPEGPCVNRQLRSKRCHNTMEGDKGTN